MNKLNKTEIERVAALARIRLSENEKVKYSEEFGAILGYIDKLKEVNTDGVEPVAHITGLENVLRKDETNKKPLEDEAAEAAGLVKMASESKDSFIKVPAIFGS